MAGCGHYMDLESPQIQDAVFGEWVMVESQFRFRACTNYRAGLMRELAVARDEVCVQMGIENMCDLNPALGSGMQVSVHVTQRVDQDSFFCVVGSDQVGRVSECGIYKRLDKIRVAHIRGNPE